MEQPNGGTVTETVKTQVNTFTQDDVNNIVKRETAKISEQYKDYDTLKSGMEKLLQEKKERDDLELTETERLKKELDEKNGILKDYESKVKTYAEQEAKRKAELEERIEKEMEGLSDDDKTLVSNVPLESKLALVKRLHKEAASPAGSHPSGGLPPTGYEAEIKACKTHAEIAKVNQKYFGSK